MRLARYFSPLLLLVPTVVGAILIAVGWMPSVTAAPEGSVNNTPRQAVSAAQSQASFLKLGVNGLEKGTNDAREGSAELAEGTAAARAGAAKLSDGMVQLQAGTGQLGDGATEIADAVGEAVNGVLAAGAARGQILLAADEAIKFMEGDPQLAETREQLMGLRQQLETAEIDSGIVDELERFRDGARELANQLDTPGYGFHDGIYSATNGAAQLREGLVAIDDGAKELNNGLGELSEGAARVNGMVDLTSTRIDEIESALPAPHVEPDLALMPAVAIMISLFALASGFGIGMLAWLQRGWWVLGVGLILGAAAPAVGLMVLGAGLQSSALAVGAGIGVLAVLAGAGAGAMCTRVCGPMIAGGIGLAASILQLGLVGMVWHSGALGWGIASGLTPLHWAANAMTGVANTGDMLYAGVGAAVLAVVAAIGFSAAYLRLGRDDRI